MEEKRKKLPRLHNGNVACISVAGEGLPFVWEKAIRYLWEYGTELDDGKPDHSIPNTKYATAMITIVNPLQEPMFHNLLPEIKTKKVEDSYDIDGSLETVFGKNRDDKSVVNFNFRFDGMNLYGSGYQEIYDLILYCNDYLIRFNKGFIKKSLMGRITIFCDNMFIEGRSMTVKFYQFLDQIKRNPMSTDRFFNRQVNV